MNTGRGRGSQNRPPNGKWILKTCPNPAYSLARMNEPSGNRRRYRWPWLVAAAVLLGLVLAIVWVGFAVKKVEEERDVNGPLPGSAPGH